ncbi:MAG: hypothetical protein ACI9DF_005666 [Verrucomicrobiales bacterium]|jgi:hypothetical protein
MNNFKTTIFITNAFAVLVGLCGFLGLAVSDGFGQVFGFGGGEPPYSEEISVAKLQTIHSHSPT